jgi:uncharacterized membrane protein YeaQ/YmgE (transglycosylase-associated protein family)
MLKPGRLLASITLCVVFHSPFFSYGQDMKQSSALNYYDFKGPSTPAKQLLTFLELQARWDDAGEGYINLSESRTNPAGSHLRFVKIDEQATPGGHGTARYRMFAEGAPENKVYAFGTWTIASSMTNDSRDIYVNGQGLLMLHKPTPEQELSFDVGADEFDVTAVTDSAVPTRYLLSSRDRQLTIYGILVPNPVMAEDKGCRLEARIAQPDATAVLIDVDRFPAKTKIPLVLESEGSSTSQMLTTNAQGHAVMIVFPYVAGIAKGMLKANAEGPGCIPSVVLPWGGALSATSTTPQLAPGTVVGTAPDSKQEHKKKSLFPKFHKSEQ